MTWKKTKHFKDLKANTSGWQDKWKDVKDEFHARLHKILDANVEQTPDGLMIAQGLVNPDMVWKEMLWDIFYTDCTMFEQVELSHSPTRAYVRVKEI